MSRNMRFGAAELDAVREVLESGNLSSFFRHFRGGNRVVDFESYFESFLEVKHAISTSSGSTALHTALLAVGVKQGWEVITTPYTFVGSWSMIRAAGGRPKAADVDPRTYNLDPESVKEIITPKTRAILPVHLLGQACDMRALMEIAEDHDLVVVEDSAQSLGSTCRYGGGWREAGTIGDAGIFSFQDTKSMTTGGEGGMVVTNDDDIAERCWYIRNHGDKYSPYRRRMMGYNYRLTEIQAAIGTVQLMKYATLFRSTQIRNAFKLMDQLPDFLSPPYTKAGNGHTYLFLGCLYDTEKAGMPRDKYLEKATEKGLHEVRPGSMISGGYTELVTDLPYYKRYRDFLHPTNNAYELTKKAVWIDRHRYPATEEDMKILAEQLEEIVSGD